MQSVCSACSRPHAAKRVTLANMHVIWRTNGIFNISFTQPWLSECWRCRRILDLPTFRVLNLTIYIRQPVIRFYFAAAVSNDPSSSRYSRLLVATNRFKTRSPSSTQRCAARPIPFSLILLSQLRDVGRRVDASDSLQLAPLYHLGRR